MTESRTHNTPNTPASDTATVRVNPASATASNGPTSQAKGTTPNWSDTHRKHLAKLAPELADKWVTDNVDETTNALTALIKRAYNDAFHAGAGANHALNEKGL